MALSDNDWLRAQAWLGSDASQDAFEEIYDRLDGDLDGSIYESLTLKLSDLIDQPTQITVPGLSISTAQNITSLQALIKAFLGQGGTDGLPEDVVIPITAYKSRRPSYR